jgi:aspartyl-tRNA(Asn)/glutamyl-tRNA(Gln) amidotransferase subunit C
MSTTPAEVSLDDVRHVASLANLELTAEELPRMAHDLNAILGHIAQLGEMLGLTPAAAGEILRPDAVKPSIDRAAVMAEAPETNGRFFKVPKVIER